MPKHIVIDARIRGTTTGRYADRLIEHLQAIDSDNRYTILVQPDDPWTPRAGNFTAVPCPFPQFSFNPLHQVKFAWQLYRLKPGLVHFTMTQQPLIYFGNIVTTTHDTTMYYFVRRGNTPAVLYTLKIALYRFLVWWSHHKSRKIIVPTKTVAQEFASLQPFTKNKAVVTYEASEPPLNAKAKQPKGVSGRFLLYVGTAFPHKNLQNMIKAFELLKAKHPALRLVITGNREEKHHKELIAWVRERHLDNSVIFPGFVSDAELKWLYEHCAAYIFTSLSEGFGLPPLEAMAHGAPVVSSNTSVMPEVYGDAAHYCDARDPQDIANKIAEVLENPQLREQLIKNGTKQLKRYSWRKMAKETLAVYKSLL
ncbi:MAG TPA: glycosyltransferase family 1 protein [Candidatus Saccharimonadales bacterium]|nr:glycosyltransferase family 1 protein [Candidatus Saccharimonadales bacterium]